MRLAVISDIHDNLWNLSLALMAVHDCDALICCGDLCSPFVIDELGRFERDIHVVFGNNDADLYRITTRALKYKNCQLHGELFESVFDERRVLVNHFDYLARPMSKSRDYDVVCFGHNHELEISHEGDCLLINPGPIMGAKFSSGRWEDVAATFAIYHTASHSAKAFIIDRVTKSVNEWRS
ncbi:MAG: metallophosphoesterase family protein [Acidobacteriaceae bacterium]|nr:metallophosphoesterase family protein [Acidobacteriaceae bacterium]MBV9781151.1 metallophosphoesterase family protein [Acidobacteriaceae bacterium]